MLNANSVLDVQVRDQSPGGARFRFEGIAVVPNRFAIKFQGETAFREAVIRWRRANEAGIEFSLPATPKPPTPPFIR